MSFVPSTLAAKSSTEEYSVYSPRSASSMDNWKADFLFCRFKLQPIRRAISLNSLTSDLGRLILTPCITVASISLSFLLSAANIGINLDLYAGVIRKTFFLEEIQRWLVRFTMSGVHEGCPYRYGKRWRVFNDASEDGNTFLRIIIIKKAVVHLMKPRLFFLFTPFHKEAKLGRTLSPNLVNLKSNTMKKITLQRYGLWKLYASKKSFYQYNL